MTTTLYIEDQDKSEAQFMSGSFVETEVKNRAYINTLGAEIFSRYLASEGVDTSKLHNLHSISKLIETVDIADILLPNIHIDVRVIFDENQIFVPISHSELDIKPDVYAVLKLSDNKFEKVDFIGYFTPKQINKDNKNDTYYFIKKDKLKNSEDFIDFIKDFSRKTPKAISEGEFFRGRTLSVSLADHDLEISEKKELIKLLLRSDELRESVLEFDNFETLSFNVASAFGEELVHQETSENNTIIETPLEEDDAQSEEQESENEEDNNENNEEEQQQPETDTLEEPVVEDMNILTSDDELEITQDPLLPDLDIAIDDFDEDFDNIEDDSKNTSLSGSIGKGIEIAADTAIAGAEAAADITAASISAEAIAAGAATQGAMDLASMAGEIIENLPDIPIDNEEEHLHDFSQVGPELKETDVIPVLDEYDTPTDLSELEPVEDYTKKEFENSEVLDFSDMDTVIPDEIIEENPDTDNLTDIGNMEKQADDENYNFDFEQDLSAEDFAIEEMPEEIEETQNSEEQEYNFDDLNENEFEEENIDEISEQEEIEEASPEQEEWVSDVDYDNLEDVDSVQKEEPEITEEVPFEDFIPEQEKEEPTVIENSVVISDKNFEVGEIEIDINKPEEQFLEGSEHLEYLYNEEDNIPGGSLLNGPNLLNRQSKGFGLGLIGIITSLIIVGIIGISISKMLKKPVEEVPQPITDTNTAQEKPSANPNELNLNEGNVVNIDNTSPISPATVQHKPQTPAQVQNNQPAKTLSPTQFIEVSKLSWEAPDYVAADQSFKRYFQSAGKSLKLSLTSDLLLASEYIYSDQVRVSINFSQDGSLKDAKILLSSGSQQVDKIVLQTVNQTLNILKAPHSLGNDSGTTVILKIYF